MDDTISQINSFKKEYENRKNYILDINKRLKLLIEEFVDLSKRYSQETDLMILDDTEKFETFEEAERYLINMVAIKKSNTLQDEEFQKYMTEITWKTKEERQKKSHKKESFWWDLLYYLGIYFIIDWLFFD